MRKYFPITAVVVLAALMIAQGGYGYCSDEGVPTGPSVLLETAGDDQSALGSKIAGAGWENGRSANNRAGRVTNDNEEEEEGENDQEKDAGRDKEDEEGGGGGWDRIWDAPKLG